MLNARISASIVTSSNLLKYHASCPALPGCHSEGDTLDESIANIRQAIAVYLESMQSHGEPLPIEDILIKPLDVVLTA
jgi:predicted RNase H-like HicB family nuclease